MTKEEKKKEQEERNRIANEAIGSLSTEIFKSGILISISIGCWDGKKRQNDKDIEMQGAHMSKTVYERGQKYLIPPSEIAVFRTFRMRLQQKLKYISYDVPGMRGSRFVPIKTYDRIKEMLTNEIREFSVAAENFIERYESIKATQIKQILRDYPNYTEEVLSSEYPSVDQLRAKFYYEWFPYTWSYSEVAKIEKEAQAMMNEKAFNLVHQASMQMRQTLMDEVKNISDRIKSCGDGKVSLKVINSVVSKISTIRDANVFDDKEIASILDDLDTIIKSGGKWTQKEVEECKIANRIASVGRSIEASIEETEQNPVWACPIVRRKIEAL